MEKIRAFIAIELPEGIRKELEAVESRLKTGNTVPVKWVAPDSIHLTLKFLGDIDAGGTGEILSAMEEAAVGILPFRLGVKDLGVFPGPAKTRVAWAGLEGDMDKLVLLQRNIDSGLEKLGYEPETRGFSPHLTLARVRDRATRDERQRFGGLVTGTPFEAGYFNVDSVHLIKSQLTKQGAIYTKIGSVRLK